MNTKDAVSTQEIPRVLGAVFQETGAKYISYYIVSIQWNINHL